MFKYLRYIAIIVTLTMIISLFSGCLDSKQSKQAGLYIDKSFKRKNENIVEASVINQGGIPRLIIDGIQTEPLMFSAASFSDVVNRQASMAISNSAKAVRISIDASLDKDIVSKQLDKCIDEYDKLNQDDYYLLISFGTTQTALKFGADNFTENFTNQFGQTFPYNSIASDTWLNYAIKLSDTLIEVVLNNPKYSNKVIGYMPCGSWGGEWFGPNFWNGQYDKSEACVRKFREWLEKTYSSDDELRKSWGNSTVTFSNANIPSNVPTYKSDDNDKPTILLEKEQQSIVDYQLFYSELMASRIAQLCKEIKKKTNNRSLTCAYYGYQYEVSIASSGCLALSTLLKEPSVDMLAGPNSYQDRNEGGVGASMSPISAIQSSGKIWMDESDYRSPICTADGDSAEAGLGDEASIKDYNNLIEIMKRQYGKNMVYNTGTWWLDLLSRGWFDSNEFWKESAKLQELYRQYSSYKSIQIPEVCFIWDDQSMCLLGQAWSVTQDILRDVKINANRSGLSFGFYSMDDLIDGRIDGAKMYVIYTPWNISANEAKILKKKLHNNGVTTVWMYGYGRTDKSIFSDLTGMNIEEQVGGNLDVTMGTDLPIKGLDDIFCSGRQVSSRYVVNDKSVKVLGKYDDNDKIAVAMTKKHNWSSIFYGNTSMSNDVLRSLAIYAGATVRLDTQDVIYDDGSLLVVHASSSGKKSINLPNSCDVYDYFNNKWYLGVDSFEVEMDSYTTLYFFYGNQKSFQKCGIGE